MRRQRREQRYARLLAIGLGISLLVHGALLALGYLSFGQDRPGEGPLAVITLPQYAESVELDTPALESELSSPTAELTPGAVLDPTAPPDLAEYRLVLERAMSWPAVAPLVPRPRITSATVESWLTPVRTPPARLAAVSDRGRGGGLDGVDFTLLIAPRGIGRGGDSCLPGGRFIRYTSRSQVAGLRYRRW